MSLDFSNRDPKDPNGIYSLDTTYTTPGWVKDGDWSTVYDSAAKAKAAGANNPVKMATAITNDGRKFNVVLDANNKPISEIGDPVGQDDDRKAAWDRTAPKPLPPGAAPTQRQPDGSINAYNPATGVYDTPTGATAVTPRTPDQQRSDAATATENETKAQEAIRIRNESQWNADPANRANGGSGRYEDHATRDTRLAKEKTEAETKARQQTIDQQSAATAAAAARRADSAEARQAADAVKPTVTTRAVQGGDGKDYTQITTIAADGKSTSVKNFGPDGKEVAEIPGDTKGRVKLGPDAPQMDTSTPEAAYQSYMKLFEYVNQKVLSGELTPDEGKAALGGPHQTVGIMLDRQKEERVTGENLRRDQLTERSQDATVAGNRLQFSQGAANTAIKTSGDLIKQAEGGSSTIVPLMILQAAMGQAAGGFREAPNVTMRGGGMLPPITGQPGGAMPSPADPNTVGAPNQLGAGAIGSAIAPVAAGVTATNAAAMNPTGANVQAATDATMAGSQAAFGSVPGMAPRPAPTSGPLLPPPPPMPGQAVASPEQPQAMVPNQIMKSGLGVGTKTADDLERELIAEGHSPEEVRRARLRAQQRYAGAVA